MAPPPPLRGNPPAGPSGVILPHVGEGPNPAPVVWAIVADIGKWGDPEHTYSGDPRNLTLEPFVRGCFCEKLSLYAGIEHATVIYAQPAKTLRLRRARPLQEFGVSGVMTWNIEPAGGGSRITLDLHVGGFADRPLADWAPIVDEVLGGQLKRRRATSPREILRHRSRSTRNLPRNSACAFPVHDASWSLCTCVLRSLFIVGAALLAAAPDRADDTARRRRRRSQAAHAGFGTGDPQGAWSAYDQEP